MIIDISVQQKVHFLQHAVKKNCFHKLIKTKLVIVHLISPYFLFTTRLTVNLSSSWCQNVSNVLTKVPKTLLYQLQHQQSLYPMFVIPKRWQVAIITYTPIYHISLNILVSLGICIYVNKVKAWLCHTWSIFYQMNHYCIESQKPEASDLTKNIIWKNAN